MSTAPPLWQNNGGFLVSLYDMETQHIRNCLRNMQLTNGRTRKSPLLYHKHRPEWMVAFQEELECREGENGNLDNLTLAELQGARDLRRVVLGYNKLDDTLPTLGRVDAPKPKTSLFGTTP